MAEQDNQGNQENNLNVDLDNPEIQKAIKGVVDKLVAEQTQGLVNKKNELLGEVKEAKGSLRSIKDKYGEDFEERFAKLEEEDRKRKEADMSLEERLMSQFGKEKEQLTGMFQTKEQEYLDKIGKLESGLNTNIKEAQLEHEIAKADGLPHFLKPALMSQVTVVEEDGEYKARVLENGVVKLKLDGTPETIADLVSRYKADAAWAPAFKSSGASGGGITSNEKSGNAGGLPANKRWSEMTAEQQNAYINKHGQPDFRKIPI